MGNSIVILTKANLQRLCFQMIRNEKTTVKKISLICGDYEYTTKEERKSGKIREKNAVGSKNMYSKNVRLHKKLFLYRCEGGLRKL